MSENYPKPNAQLEREIAACKTQADLDSVLLRWQESHGLATRYDRVALPGSVRTSSSQPTVEAQKDGGQQLLRRAVTLSDGTIRLIEAESVGGLDTLENFLRTGRIW